MKPVFDFKAGNNVAKNNVDTQKGNNVDRGGITLFKLKVCPRGRVIPPPPCRRYYPLNEKNELTLRPCERRNFSITPYRVEFESYRN